MLVQSAQGMTSILFFHKCWECYMTRRGLAVIPIRQQSSPHTHGGMLEAHINAPTHMWGCQRPTSVHPLHPRSNPPTLTLSSSMSGESPADSGQGGRDEQTSHVGEPARRPVAGGRALAKPAPFPPTCPALSQPRQERASAGGGARGRVDLSEAQLGKALRLHVRSRRGMVEGLHRRCCLPELPA